MHRSPTCLYSVQEQRPPAGNDGGPLGDESFPSALRVNLKKLKVEDELRRIFGSKFIKSGRHNDDEGTTTFISSIVLA